MRFDSTPNNETTVISGDDVTLECVANGNPAPYPITWLQNNTEIITSDGIVINETSLTLYNAQPNDTAIYQCVAMTTRERISAYTYLIVECELIIYEALIIVIVIVIIVIVIVIVVVFSY